MEKLTQKRSRGEDTTDLTKVWGEVLEKLEGKLKSNNFSTWFSNTYIMRVKDNTAFVGVQNEFVRQWIQEKYQKDLLREIRGILGDSIKNIKFVISNRTPSKSRGRQVEIKSKEEGHSLTLRFEDYAIDRGSNLNPKYNFDSFIVCPFNEFVYATASAVVEKPGISYNPFYIHGSTGCGKTHVLQAIGNTLKKNHPTMKVLYVTSEMFANEYISAVQKGVTEGFKERYRGIDVFLVDDTQFFAAKERTQEEFFHTMNTLLDSNKQVVFSSDVHPAELAGMSDRLKSRFGAGMVTHLPQPDLESRIVIFREKLKLKGCITDNDTIEHVAREARGSVRAIEGLVNRIEMEARLKNGIMPDHNKLSTIVKGVLRPKDGVSSEEVIKRVCGYYKVSEESVLSAVRRKEVVRARQIIMFILRDLTNIPYSSIGIKLKRDHTTVIHSCEKIRDKIRSDSNLRSEVENLKQILNLV